MFTNLLLIVLIVAALSPYFFSPNRIRVGDIVLYRDPESDVKERNMITTVLYISRIHQTGLIRVSGTQMVVRLKYLQVLKVDKAFPILVPEKPCVEVCLFKPSGEPCGRTVLSEGEAIPEKWAITSPGNQASFLSIPLSWFGYGMKTDEKRRLCTTI